MLSVLLTPKVSLLQTAFGGDKKVNIWLETIKTELKKSAESKTSVEGWRQLFERYDLDGSGDVDKSEFVQTAREVLEIPADAISDAELDRLFEEADADGGGEISGTVPSIIERRPALFFLGHISPFCPVFSRFFAVFSVLTPGFQKVAPKDRGSVP